MSRWVVAALVALPTALSAQTIGVAPFVSTNGSLPDSPTLFGLSIATHASALAFRASTGVNPGGNGFPLPGLADDGWVADFDVNLAPTRFWKKGHGATGLEPALLFGVGLEGGKSDDEAFAVPNASYGGGVWYSPASWFRLESEARYRSPLRDRDALPAGVAPGWEFRVGAMIQWRRDPAPPVVARRPERPRRARGSGRPSEAPDPGVVDGAGRNDRTRIVTRNVAAATSDASLASSVLGTAHDYLGTQYRFGGTDPGTGLDCSAFIQRVYRTHGIRLPRTSRQQVKVGTSVDPTEDLQPGDLLFFAGNGSRIDHVALYTGDNVIIHSTSSGGGVVYDDLLSHRGRWFREHLVAARRIIGTNLAAAAFIPMPADGELDPPDHAPTTGRRQ